MATIERSGTAVWRGDLAGGDGTVSTESGVLRDEEYTFATRFENAPGTNPEELIAGAHAACYSMAFANLLSEKGYDVGSIETTATIELRAQNDGFSITKSALKVRGRVQEIDAETFERLAGEADGVCPVSNLLRPGLEIELAARLA